MNCKFCSAELEEGVTLCPVCGKENAEPAEDVQPAAETVTEEAVAEEVTAETVLEGAEAEVAADEAVTAEAETAEEAADEEVPLKKKPKTWQIVVTAVCGLVVLAILAGAVLYGLGIDLRPRENDVYYKDSYTVEAADADKWSEKVVATVGDMELTNGELQLYYWSGVIDFLNNYSYYLSSMGLDYTQPLDTQKYFDQDLTWQQFFLENAVLTWHKYAALIQKAEETGYTLSAEEQEFLDTLPEHLEELLASSEYATVEEMLEADMGPLCTMDGYIKYMENYSTALGYFDLCYAELAPTDEQVEAYFEEHADALAESGITKEAGKYYDVRHILISPEGGTTDENGTTTYSDAEWEACLADAEELLVQWEEEYGDETGFALLAQEYSVDTGSSTNGGLYEDLTSETNFVEEFKAWYLDESRQVGDTGIVQSVYGYHIMYFSGSTDIWYSESYQAAQQEGANELVEQLMETWPMEVNFKKIALGEVDLAGQ